MSDSKAIFDDYNTGRVLAQKNGFGINKQKSTYMDIFEVYVLFIEQKITLIFIFDPDETTVAQTSEFWEICEKEGLATLEDLFFVHRYRQLGKVVRRWGYRSIMSKRILECRSKKLKVEEEANDNQSIRPFEAELADNRNGVDFGDFSLFEFFHKKGDIQGNKLAYLIALVGKDEPLGNVFRLNRALSLVEVSGVEKVIVVSSLDGFSLFKLKS